MGKQKRRAERSALPIGIATRLGARGALQRSPILRAGNHHYIMRTTTSHTPEILAFSLVLKMGAGQGSGVVFWVGGVDVPEWEVGEGRSYHEGGAGDRAAVAGASGVAIFGEQGGETERVGKLVWSCGEEAREEDCDRGIGAEVTHRGRSGPSTRRGLESGGSCVEKAGGCVVIESVVNVIQNG